MPISNLLNVAITLDVLRAGRTGFGKPGIISQFDTSIFSERAQTVAQRAELIALGFSSGSAEVAAFEAMTAQARRPRSVTIGRRGAPTAQVDTQTVGGTTNGNWIHTLDGVPFTFAASSNTAGQIRDGLVALIDADPRYVATAVSTAQYTVAAFSAGDHFVSEYTSPSSALTGSTTTPNVGIYEDLAAIRAYDPSFYGFIEATHDSHVIREASRWAEGEIALFLAQSNEAGILTNATTDIASRLQTLARTRTVLAHHALDSEFLDAAWLGKQLPTDPGSSNWAWQVLRGLTPNSLSVAEVDQIRAKYANWYEQVGTGGTVFDGRTPSGIFVDLIHGRDKLVDEVVAALTDLLQRVEKVPYTEEGIAMVDATLESAAARLAGTANDPNALIIRSSINVTGPELGEIPEDDIANRRLPARTLNATIQGAVNDVDTDGSLTISISTAA